MAGLKPIVPPEEIERRLIERAGGKAEPKVKPKVEPKVEPEHRATGKTEPVKPEPKGKVITDPKTEPTFSLEAFNKTYGLELKSPDEVKEYIENAKKYKEESPKFQELGKKYADLELKSKVNPFADEVAQTINEMRKAGEPIEKIRAFIDFQSVDLAKMTNEEKMIKAYQLRDGLTEKEARIAFDDEYSIKEGDYEIDEDGDVEKQREKIARQIEKDNIRLKRDAKGIDSFLSDYKKTVSTVEKPEEKFKKSWNEYVPQVKEVAPVIANSYKGFEISLNGKQGEEGRPFKLQVPDDFRKEIPQMVENFLMSEFASGHPVTLNQEGVGRINTYLDGVLKAAYFDKYIVDSNIHTESTTEERVTNKFSNSQPRKTDKAPVELPDALKQWKQERLKPRHKIFS